MAVTFSVFTKPWREPIPQLARRIANLGFDGIELPVRPGYPVTPDTLELLPETVRQMADAGLKVFSIASSANERTIAACADNGIPTIRIMAPIGDGGYVEAVRRTRSKFDNLLPLLRQYGVQIGVQNHYGGFVSNASGLRELVAGYERAQVAAVWDAAHNALNGEDPELAIDIVWDSLGMVNLKNAFWKLTSGPEAAEAQWTPYWTAGPHGLASWRRVAAELQRREYSGVVCLTAEYSDEERVDSLIAQDIQFAKSLWKAGL